MSVLQKETCGQCGTLYGKRTEMEEKELDDDTKLWWEAGMNKELYGKGYKYFECPRCGHWKFVGVK